MNVFIKRFAKNVIIVSGVINMISCSGPIDIGIENADGLDDTEKIGVEINGDTNGMYITSTNPENPVLLFISGGPGVPEVWLNESYSEKYPNRIADYFTVCYWDYYGEGLSYSSDINADDITIERLAYDAHAVADYLKEKFNKKKIYLMAHSSGTNLGLYLAQTDPEDFCCYFGMGQDYLGHDSIRFYEEGYKFMKSSFEENNDSKGLKMLNKLVDIKEDGTFSMKNPESAGAKWEEVLLRAGCGTTREMRSDIKDIFFKQMGCECYTVTEKINFWRGKKLCSESPYRNFHPDPESPALIPVVFLSGYYDYTTPITLSRELFEKLEAPEKAFYTFHNSAHSPLWEENELCLKEMLNHVR